MIPVFSNVTDDGFRLLSKILVNPGSVPADFFFDDPTVDGQIELLLASGLLESDSHDIISVTELGRAALKEYEHHADQLRRQRIFSIIQFTVPTLISLAALVVSIIALLG